MILIVNPETKRCGRVFIDGISEEDYVKKNSDKNLIIVKDSEVPSARFIKQAEDGSIVEDIEASSELEYNIRLQERISLLKKTSEIVSVPDFPISEDEKQEVLTYRQALRDFTSTKIFPDMPECVKKHYNSL